MGRFDQPFRGTAAVAAGRMTTHELHRDYVRVYRDVYIGRDTQLTARVRASAAAAFVGPEAVLVGRSAAALYSTKWIDPADPAEVVRNSRCQAPPNLVYRQYALTPSEIFVKHGIKMTTPARTAFDLGRTLARRDAVVMLDALCRATLLDPAAIEAVAAQHPRAPRLGQLRAVLPLVDRGAESPPESLTRLLLVDAGLPKPETQIKVFDTNDGFVARCDMGWRQWRVVVEYDGSDHRDGHRHAADIERYAQIDEAGWTAVTVGGKLLHKWPDVLVDRVTKKLRAAGAPV